MMARLDFYLRIVRQVNLILKCGNFDNPGWNKNQYDMICSKEDFVEKHVDNLKQKFSERGYPEDSVSSKLNRAQKMERTDLLKPKNTWG